jgi:2-C-methyl-D-erythritol 4-phosphate cytidylyltransferase/2-C-methyl-D-erythritol 2,4-cyclodiphosphate synthase
MNGVPMVARAVRPAAGLVDEVVIAAPIGKEEVVRESLTDLEVVVVTGGPTRQASVRAALEVVSPECGIVVVHDAARPFATKELFATVIGAVVRGSDAAIPVIEIADTVKRVRAGEVVGTENRAELGLAQTPQAFRADVLREAHERAAEAGLDLTDDAALVEWAGYRVVAVPGEPGNFKITTTADLDRAGIHA